MAIATPPKNPQPARTGLPSVGSTLAGQLRKGRGTWRRQIALLAWMLLGLAVVAFLAAITTTNARIQTFQTIAAVAVPSINATNDAVQSLSSEVSSTAEYILQSQGRGNTATNTASTGNKATLLKDIEKRQADFDRAVQQGYNALVTYQSNPDPKFSLTYISTYKSRLYDALSQARGLADRGDIEGATQTYLNGQNDYYLQVINSVHYLREIHLMHLEDAEKDATSAASLQQYLAGTAAVLFALALLATNLWLTFRVKRVLVPLVNIALVIVIIYSAFLWTVFSSSRNSLSQVVASNNTVSAVSDAQLFLTDASADQVEWIIGGKPNDDTSSTTKFIGDQIYAQDFKDKLTAILSNQDSNGNSNPDFTPCPSTSRERANYAARGSMASVCKTLSNNNELEPYNRFVAAYKTWTAVDTRFRSAVEKDGNINGGLDLRAKEGSPALRDMTIALGDLRNLNVNEYNQKSTEGTDSLNLAGQLAWVIYPLALLLAGAGLLVWRREF